MSVSINNCYIKLSSGNVGQSISCDPTSFKLDRPIILTKLGVSPEYHRQEVKLVIGNNRVVLEEAAYVNNGYIRLSKPLKLYPGREYYININNENRSRAICN